MVDSSRKQQLHDTKGVNQAKNHDKSEHFSDIVLTIVLIKLYV